MSSSYRQILRSSSIIGGASAINILLGLLRIKVAAILLGPAGVGLIGLLTNLVSTVSGVAGLGVGSAGTRQVAKSASSGDDSALAAARRALLLGTIALALAGAIAFWLLRDILAAHVLGDASASGDIGWLAIAVGLVVASASQGALLNGMRRIGDLAWVSIGSAVMSTIVGSLSLWAWGSSGIVAFVVAGPLASFVLGHLYVSRLPRSEGRVKVRAMTSEWSTMVRLGFAFMVAGLAGTVGQLAVRVLVQRELGVDALGHFQAAWAISMTYIGFVLAAMGTDYYPRLVAVIDDPPAVTRLVNEQMEVALLLAAPVLLAMLGLAPWVIELLYSDVFGPAVEIFRWQVLGDVLKIASWPLGYILAASGAGKTFMATEWLSMGCFVALSYLLLPVLGLLATGLSFLAMYVLLFAVVLVLARRNMRFRFASRVLGLLACVVITCGVVVGIAGQSSLAGALLGLLAAVFFSVYALIRLAHAGDLEWPIGRLAERVHSGLKRVGIRRGS